MVANPLVSCGRCDPCISGAQNLCESWKLLGLGTTAGTFAEYVTLPLTQVYEIPDSLSTEQAILAEPLANIVHLFRIVSPPPFFRLAIVGSGTMGALATLAALSVGARDVLATDINDQRLETMRKLGASATVNAATPPAVADARRSAGQGTLINERLGLSVFESRKCRSANRCPPESKTGERLVFNTGIPGS